MRSAPEHTFESVAATLLAGLRDGSIVLEPVELGSRSVDADPTPAVSPLYSAIKAAVDRSAAALALLLALPAMLFCGALIRLSSAGPAFYTQVRVGRGGRPFRIVKLRTMYHNCEQASGVRWATPGDSRVTALGRSLRRMHLDQLPNLFNVLRGEMSLVGPASERPEIVPHLESQLPRYRARLAVKPGLTGLAQLLVPRGLDLDWASRSLTADLYYVRHASLWLDVRILLATAAAAILPAREVVSLCCGLPSYEAVVADAPTEHTGDPAPGRARGLPEVFASAPTGAR